MNNKSRTLGTVIMLMVLIIMLGLSLVPNVTFADDSLDIKIDSARGRNRDQKSELDISKYDFFTADEINMYEEYHNKSVNAHEKLKGQLFVTENKKPNTEKTEPALYADSLGLFVGNSDYELQQSESGQTGDYQTMIIISGFMLLGVLSFLAARMYSKSRRRKG